MRGHDETLPRSRHADVEEPAVAGGGLVLAEGGDLVRVGHVRGGEPREDYGVELEALGRVVRPV